MRRRRKAKTIERLNLIPIMDAIFIFIFFLLMSAQFIDIFSIGSDLPVVSEVPPEQKKEPLNLTLKIMKEKVFVQTGVNGKTEKSFDLSDEGLKEMSLFLQSLKTNHPDEKTATITPGPKVKYKRIIKVLDGVRTFKTETSEKDLFPQVVFSNLVG